MSIVLRQSVEVLFVSLEFNFQPNTLLLGNKYNDVGFVIPAITMVFFSLAIVLPLVYANPNGIES